MRSLKCTDTCGRLTKSDFIENRVQAGDRVRKSMVAPQTDSLLILCGNIDRNNGARSITQREISDLKHAVRVPLRDVVATFHHLLLGVTLKVEIRLFLSF